MKTKFTLAILTMGMSVAAMAQEVDDMYFTSRDRAVVNAAAQISLTKKYQQEDLMAVRSNPVNPSDSYSGRGVNPEYTAQSKKGMAVVQENPDYFLPTYQPKNVNKSLYNGSASSYTCNCNTGYGNPYYSGMGYGGFGSPYGMYSPYSMYSPYGYSPYSGLNMSMGFGSMYSMNSMYYGMGYGMGSMYGMGGMGSMGMYGMGYGMGSMYGMGGMYGYNPYYGYGYPTMVVVPDANATSYGRHSSRSTSLNNYVDNTRSAATTSGTMAGSNVRSRDGGRMSTSSQPNYYDPSWRSNTSNFPSRSYDNGGSFTRSGNSGWGNSGFDSGSRTRSSFDNMGGTRSSFGGGGFSGGGMSGGGGGGHSRGRN